MSQVGIPAALVAGVLALLSPCSAVLLPAFFAYAFGSVSALLVRTTAFLAGLLLVLVPLGLGVRAASTAVIAHRQTLVLLAGGSVIAMGVLLASGRGGAVPGATRLASASASLGGLAAGTAPSAAPQVTAGRQVLSWAATVLLGAVYGLAGFCSGPVLGAILGLAATASNPTGAGILLTAYAVGMTVPLFVLAALWDTFDVPGLLARHARVLVWGPLRVPATRLVAGLLFIGVGVLVVATDGTSSLGTLPGMDGLQVWASRAEITATTALAELPLWSLPAAASLGALGLAAYWSRARS